MEPWGKVGFGEIASPIYPIPLADLWVQEHSPRFRTTKDGRRESPATCWIRFWLALSTSSLGLEKKGGGT